MSEPPAKRPRGRPKAAPRRKWEYLQHRSENGFYVEQDGGLDQFGADGWDLVAIYRTGDAMHAPIFYAVFKREIV